MEFEFLTPVSQKIEDYIKNLKSNQLGAVIDVHTKEGLPEFDGVKIAILGVLENRGDANRIHSVDLDYFRKELYRLYAGNWNAKIVDLGNILPGNTLSDSYYVVSKIVSQLIKRNIIPIVLGGTQDLTYPLYRAYDNLEQMVNLTTIDSKFDLGSEEEGINKDSYLYKIIIDEPNNLFNYSNIGYQTYYNSQEEIDLIEKLYFDAYRLGEISNKITLSEPVLRDTDFVSIDMQSVESSYSGNLVNFVPNGFSGKEICALARYAGISDKVTMFGIFNHNNTNAEAVLLAQIVWYFVEGYHYRSFEYPFGSRKNYLKYIVPLDEQDVVFYKSDKTDRWWIEIPFSVNSNNKLKQNTLLPCSYDEYLAACEQEIPERWWKAYRKNIC